MPAAAGQAQPSGYGQQILEPFNIPTGIGPGPPVREPPHPALTFPVFTPPAASSYGTTNPMPIPWTPPDLAGAIDRGINTGAKLATDAIVNKRSLNEIAAQEAVSKHAIAAMSDPNMQRNIGYEVGPQGYTARVISPAEADIARANLARTGAETRLAQAGVEEKYGRTPGAQAEAALRQREAALKEEEAKKTAVQTGILGVNQFDRHFSDYSGGENVNVGQQKTGQSGQATTTDDNTSNVDFGGL